MKSIFSEIRTAIIATLVLAAVLSGIYPLVVYGIGQLLFPRQANGSLIEGKDRSVVGTTLLGQNFSGSNYFHPRPSAAGAAGYDAASSSGSNLGPTSQKLLDQVNERVAAYRALNSLDAETAVPADAVTASGSGLDPHISVKNALLQAPRVAKERQLPLDTIKALIGKHTEGPQLGFLGEPAVNTLTLNIAMDGISSSAANN